MPCSGSGDRALSNVLGAVLLVGIVLVLATVGAAMAFSLVQEREPAPEVALSLHDEGDGVAHQLEHEHGEALDGDQVSLRGTTDPDALAGVELAAGERATVYPTDDEVTVVWTDDHDTSHVLHRLTAEWTVPEPDEACPWVDAETNGGSDDITIDDKVVDCDVETDKVIEVRNGGVVIGETVSDTKVLDAGEAVFYGDVTVEETLNLQDGAIHGSATSASEDVKLDNGSVSGGVTAVKAVEVVDGSSVDGSVESANKPVKVLGGSSVGGSVTSGGEDVKLEDASIDGSVTAADEVKIQASSSVAGDVESDAYVEVLDGSSVDGNVRSDADQVKVVSSTVSGSLVTDGTVKLDGATVEGDVYVDSADFECSSSTVNGQDCGTYTPEDPTNR